MIAEQLWPALAAVEHGPDLHGGVLMIALLVIVVVVGLVYAAVKGRRRER